MSLHLHARLSVRRFEFEKSQQKSAAKENESQTPRTEQSFFNGEDLTGWKGDSAYWSVQDNAIVGHSDEPVEGNKFIWSEVPVDDFYLSMPMPARRIVSLGGTAPPNPMTRAGMKVGATAPAAAVVVRKRRLV